MLDFHPLVQDTRGEPQSVVNELNSVACLRYRPDDLAPWQRGIRFPWTMAGRAASGSFAVVWLPAAIGTFGAGGGTLPGSLEGWVYLAVVGLPLGVADTRIDASGACVDGFSGAGAPGCGVVYRDGRDRAGNEGGRPAGLASGHRAAPPPCKGCVAGERGFAPGIDLALKEPSLRTVRAPRIAMQE